MSTYLLHLPYDRVPLSQNDRMHWRTAAGIKRQVKADAHTMCIARRLPKGLERVHVELHYVPKVVRRRDTDNPAPSLKAALDGITEYGLVVDDSSEHVTSECVIHEPDRSLRASRVYLLITDLTEAS